MCDLLFFINPEYNCLVNIYTDDGIRYFCNYIYIYKQPIAYLLARKKKSLSDIPGSFFIVFLLMYIDDIVIDRDRYKTRVKSSGTMVGHAPAARRNRVNLLPVQ